MYRRLLKYYFEILRWEKLSPEQAVRRQVEKFRRVFEHTCAHSTYYRDLYRDAGVLDLKVRTPEDIRRIPIVRKSMLRGVSPQDLLTVSPDAPGLNVHATSGSTGEPFTVFGNRFEDYAAHVRVFRGLRRLGYSPSKSLTLVTRYQEGTKLTVEQDLGLLAGVQKRLGIFQRRIISIYDPVDKIIDELQEQPPDILWSTPSIMLMVCHRLFEREISLDFPVLCLTSETLFPHQRELLRKAVAQKVIGHYGLMECPSIAMEAGEGDRKAVFGEAFYLEFMNSGNEGGSRVGTLVATNLQNLTMPFIRYDLEDIAEEVDDPGFPNQILGPIIGRVDDMITLDDGSTLAHHHAHEMFMAFDRVEQWKFVQTLDNVELRLKLREEFKNQEKEVFQEARRIWNSRFPSQELVVLAVDEFGIDPLTGKVRNIEKRMGGKNG